MIPQRGQTSSLRRYARTEEGRQLHCLAKLSGPAPPSEP